MFSKMQKIFFSRRFGIQREINFMMKISFFQSPNIQDKKERKRWPKDKRKATRKEGKVKKRRMNYNREVRKEISRERKKKGKKIRRKKKRKKGKM